MNIAEGFLVAAIFLIGLFVFLTAVGAALAALLITLGIRQAKKDAEANNVVNNYSPGKTDGN